MKKLIFLCLIISFLLFLALLNQPYTFYICLRLVVFIGGGYLIYRLLKLNIYNFEDLQQSLFGNIITSMFIFNPIYQFSLERGQWLWLDIIFGIIYFTISIYLICVNISDKKKHYDYFLINVTKIFELIFIFLLFASIIIFIIQIE
ncbi:MAG: hypothetical protein PHG18_01890 [Bacilli bacterium]|nr:hypothetical protein [Bacilli bacterium]